MQVRTPADDTVIGKEIIAAEWNAALSGRAITAATLLYAGVPWLASMTVWRGVVSA